MFPVSLNPEWTFDSITGSYNWRFRPVWRNSGDTPTKSLRLYTDCELRVGPVPRDFDFKRIRQAAGTGFLVHALTTLVDPRLSLIFQPRRPTILEIFRRGLGYSSYGDGLVIMTFSRIPLFIRPASAGLFWSPEILTNTTRTLDQGTGAVRASPICTSAPATVQLTNQFSAAAIVVAGHVAIPRNPAISRVAPARLAGPSKMGRKIMRPNVLRQDRFGPVKRT